MTEARVDTDATLASYRALATSAATLLAEAVATRPAERMAAGTRLRHRWPAELVATAFTVAELRERATAKFPDRVPPWLTREALEQASGAAPASFRAHDLATRLASRVAGRGGTSLVADLGCGIGGDTLAYALAPSSEASTRVLAVEVDPLRAWCAAENAREWGVAERVSVAVSDVRHLRLAGNVDAAFVDPARRSAGTRTSYATGEPPWDWAVGLAQDVPLVAIKTAPGIPHEALPPGWDADWVAVGRDLKEAVLWSPAPGPTGRGVRRAVVLDEEGVHTLTADPAVPAAPLGERGPWLLDPNPAVTRAGAVSDLAALVGGWQIDARIAFLCLNAPVRTPFARLLQVVASLPFDIRAVRAALRANDIGPLDVRRRGLAGDVELIRRKVRADGSRTGVLVMTRARDRPWALICVAARDQ